MDKGLVVVHPTPGMEEEPGPCVLAACPGTRFRAHGTGFAVPGRGTCVVVSDGAQLSLRECLLSGRLREYNPKAIEQLAGTKGQGPTSHAGVGLCRGLQIAPDEEEADGFFRPRGVPEQPCTAELVSAVKMGDAPSAGLVGWLGWFAVDTPPYT